MFMGSQEWVLHHFVEVSNAEEVYFAFEFSVGVTGGVRLLWGVPKSMEGLRSLHKWQQL